MSGVHPFEEFVRQHQDMVYSTALRLLAQPAEAEDVAQEVFLRAYQHFDRLRTSPTAGGWLRTVATRLALNHLTRYRQRWKFFSEFTQAEDEESGPGSPPFAIARDAGTASDPADRHEIVHRALMTLPDHQRVPLVLYHMEGYSYDEIAHHLGVSLAKVKTDIHRAREAMRRKLRLHGGDELEESHP